MCSTREKSKENAYASLQIAILHQKQLFHCKIALQFGKKKQLLKLLRIFFHHSYQLNHILM